MMKHEPVEIDGKTYDVFCRCNAEWDHPNTKVPADFYKSRGYCPDCGYFPWIYPDRPIEQPEEKLHNTDCAVYVNSRHDCTCGVEEKQMDKPWAMVPDPDGKLFRVVFGETEVEVSNGGNTWFKKIIVGYKYQNVYPFRTLNNGIWSYARLPQPKRPDIAIDEPVWVGCLEVPSLFAGWSEDGNPQVWSHGRHSHTTRHKTTCSRIRTRSGIIWPPEGE
jgi:hypothetical protein